MVNPVKPGGSGNASIGGGQASVPPGPPLPADNVWVKNLATLFPQVPLGEIQTFALQFQTNMFQALNSQIASDLKKARETAKKFKESIEGNG
jgi:hypothetical protein